MAMNDFNIGFLAGLDGTKSKAKLNQDIDAIKKSLKELELKAKLDPNQVKALENQLNTLKVNLNNVSIDKASLNNLVSQINNSLSGIKLQIPNLNTGNVSNQAQQVGQQIGNNIAQGISSGVNKAKSELKSFSDLTNFSELNKKIEHLQIDPSVLKNYSAILDEVKAKYAEFGQVKITNEQFNNGVLEKFKVNIEQVNGDLKETKSFMMSLNDDKDTFVFDGIIKGSESVVQHLDKTKNAINQTADAINALKDKAQSDKIQLSMGVNGDTTSQIEVLRNNFTKLGLSADEVKTKMSGVDAEVKTLKSLMNSGADNSAIVTQFEKLQIVLTQTQNNLKQTRSDYSLLATEQQRLSLANTIEAWNQKNTRATKEVRAENDRYVASLRDLNNQMTKIDFNKINNGFKQNENSMRTLNRLGASLKDQMKQAANSFTQWISVSSAIMGVVYSTKQAVSELKEVDTLLTEISKANDQLSKTQLKQIGYSSFDVSGKYGKKATDYLSGVQEASRAGYVNAEGIAELSVAAQGAGDMTAELANQYIIATDKAYKLGGSVEKLTEVLDGSNYITNHNAVNMTELAEGMSIVGSQASSLGVGVDQTTAALGTMIATTQQSGSEMARAFKAILLNIQQVSDEEEGIDAEGLTKYEKACNALNVSLKETKNGVMSLRDPMEVIKDLSEEYTKLDASDIRRTNLLSSVGGKLRANALNALLENYDMYSKMLEEYSQGTGSMAQEAEKTAKSWE